jgi:hypothetical protein
VKPHGLEVVNRLTRQDPTDDRPVLAVALRRDQHPEAPPDDLRRGVAIHPLGTGVPRGDLEVEVLAHVMANIVLGDGETPVRGGSGFSSLSRFVPGAPPSMDAEMRTLVIEDERTLAGFIEQALHAEGYAVTVAQEVVPVRVD